MSAADVLKATPGGNAAARSARAFAAFMRRASYEPRDQEMVAAEFDRLADEIERLEAAQPPGGFW